MASDKTEKATARRRQRARDEGQFSYSQEVTGTLTLLAAIGTLSYLYVNPLGFRMFFEQMMKLSLSADSEDSLMLAIRQSGIYFLTIVAPVFIAIAGAALIGNLAQGLPVFTKEGAALKFERLNPVQGL